MCLYDTKNLINTLIINIINDWPVTGRIIMSAKEKCPGRAGRLFPLKWNRSVAGGLIISLKIAGDFR